MTTCTALSDRMPEVALGRSRWTEEEARHLAFCADCRAEWALVTAATRVGDSLPTPDPAVTSARVLGRLALERKGGRARSGLWIVAGLAAAAVVALAVWTPRDGATPGQRPAPPPVASRPTPVAQPGDTPAVAVLPPATAVELPLPELDSLPAEALDSLLQVLDEPLARGDAGDATLGDAGDQELEQVLAGLEG
jgi:hypothetical protein